MQDVQIQYRPKVKSLEGVDVLLFTIDGVKIEPSVKVTVEEVSQIGFLFRGADESLIFASSAAFTVVRDDG